MRVRPSLPLPPPLPPSLVVETLTRRGGERNLKLGLLLEKEPNNIQAQSLNQLIEQAVAKGASSSLILVSVQPPRAAAPPEDRRAWRSLAHVVAERSRLVPARFVSFVRSFVRVRRGVRRHGHRGWGRSSSGHPVCCPHELARSAIVDP